ncbi:cupin domain-containing protein [bacterium]|nr:MAG: cupin domain-containing protein [bacterium]
MPVSEHIASVTDKAPAFRNSSGSISRMESRDLPVMKRLSLRRLLLAPQGVREPHWHANAHELGYCLRGRHRVTIAGSHNLHSSFTLSAGEAFFVPSGALHHIENIGDVEGEMILGFSSERTEDFGLSGTLGSFTDAVLGNSLDLPASDFADLKRTPHDTCIGGRAGKASAEGGEEPPSPYKLSVAGMVPQIQNTGGAARTAQSATWPILKDLAMFSLQITDTGMREIHWHPETAEMGYVTGGVGRMTILSPGGSTDTYEMRSGDVYFIPRAYPHHIENVGAGDLTLLVFFDQSTPGDIGVQGVAGAYSTEVLAATFGVEPSAIPAFPTVDADPLIVPRVNPIDPSLV